MLDEWLAAYVEPLQVFRFLVLEDGLLVLKDPDFFVPFFSLLLFYLDPYV